MGFTPVPTEEESPRNEIPDLRTRGLDDWEQDVRLVTSVGSFSVRRVNRKPILLPFEWGCGVDLGRTI